MHLLRAIHAAIWKCCLHGGPTVPDPTKCGWQARHSLDAVATSTRCCLGIVGLQVCPFLWAAKVYMHGKWTIACIDMCKLQWCSNQRQQEDGLVELGDSDDDIDAHLDVWLWCLIIMFEHSCHATHTCMLQTCGIQKPQEDDSFQLGAITEDIDEQFYVWLWCLNLMFDKYVWKQLYLAMHTCMWQTCGNQKPQEKDTFEFGDIDDYIDEQFYVWLYVWSLCLNATTMIAATTLYCLTCLHVNRWLSLVASMAFLVTCYHVCLI